MLSTLWRLVFIAALLLATGCATQTGTTQRFFWPMGAQNPKIEYLRFYETEQDVRPRESALAQAILGVERGERIFSAPRGIASNGAGIFYVADSGRKRVLVCDTVKGEVRSLLDPDGEPFGFPTPMGLALDGRGGGYVSDTATGSIFRFDAQETVVREIGKGVLNRPNGMAFDGAAQKLYVADTANHQIAVFSAAGDLIERLGKRGMAGGEFNFPLDLDLAPDGRLVVLDALNARVQVLETDGRFVRQFGERGTALGSFMLPKSLAVDPRGHVYVSDSQAHKFVIFDLDGNFLLTIGGRSVLSSGGVHPGGFDLPQGVEADPDGSLWVVDSLSRMVHRFQFLTEAYLQQHPIRPGETYQNDPPR